MSCGAGAEAAGGGEASTSIATSEAQAAKDGKAPPTPSPQMASMLAVGQDKTSAIYKAAVKIQAQFRGYVVSQSWLHS